ncbi:hypothetical protein ITI46_07920 [Streptomyces oryzae]|uniref:Septum formation-related domain-containing protein n=1 Tax=Streptomyces oryzae TaxID=1434886 RepID=A0ABS3X8B7_9ACTN|nr:hypothetical protein [Streptomyces oryzae]MBO8191612.1 hypothetical protein [Streptomyces oryzae]
MRATTQGPNPSPQMSRGRAIGCLAVVILGFGALFVLAWNDFMGSPDRAEKGDCVKKEGSDSIEVVACDSSDAEFRVSERIDKSVTVDIAAQAACSKKTDDFTSVYSKSEGDDGFVLCLARK